MGNFTNAFIEWGKGMIAYRQENNKSSRQNIFNNKIKPAFDDMAKAVVDDEKWDEKDEEVLTEIERIQN